MQCSAKTVIEYAGEAPVVLTLEVITVRILDHEHCEGVASLPEIRCYVIFRRFLGALVVSYFMPIYPEERGGSDFFEPEEDLLSFPCFRDGEGGAVGSRRVVVVRYVRRGCDERS